MNWKHNGPAPPNFFNLRTLVIAFDNPVQSLDLHEHSVTVEFQGRAVGGLRCWCPPERMEIHAGKLDQPCTANSGFNLVNKGPGVLADAVQIVIPSLPPIADVEEPAVRVRVKGDFIRGRHHLTGKFHGVDANHLPDWLPLRKTGDGIEGGTFESWFRISQG